MYSFRKLLKQYQPILKQNTFSNSFKVLLGVPSAVIARVTMHVAQLQRTKPAASTLLMLVQL
jgi:hypothetical protein